MKPLILLLSLSLVAPLAAQDSRMDADLRMMQQVLAELFRTGNPHPNHYRVNTRSLQATYTPGYGIVLYTPTYVPSGPAGRAYAYRMEGNNIVIQRPGTAVPDEGEDSLRQAVTSLLRYFLSEYGDLAGDLTDDEHILLVYKEASSTHRFTLSTTWDHEAEAAASAPLRVTAAAKAAHLRAYRKGSLSPDDFQAKIVVDDGQGEKPSSLPYRVLGKVLTEVYEAEVPVQDRPYVSTHGDLAIFPAPQHRPRLDYERLPGYGVTYQIAFNRPPFPRVYTSRPDRPAPSPGKVVIQGSEVLPLAWDTQVEALYATTTGALRQAVVEYGRTLRDLTPAEWLVVQVSLPPCDSCTLPAEVTLRVQGSTLARFDRRGLTLKEALAAVEIVERGTARTATNRRQGIFINPELDMYPEGRYEEDE